MNGRNFIRQQDNDQKHTANPTKNFIKEKKVEGLYRLSQSLDLNPTEHAFSEEKTEGRNPAIQIKRSCNIKEFVISVGRRQPASKGYAAKYLL